MDFRIWTQWEPPQIREYFPPISFWRARFPTEYGLPNVRVVTGVHFSDRHPNSAREVTIEFAKAENYIANLWRLKVAGNKAVDEPGYIVKCPTRIITMVSWLHWLKDKQAFTVESVPEFLPGGRYNVCG